MKRRTEVIGVRCTAELRAAVCRAANQEQISLSEIGEKAMAAYVGKPKLAEVQRPSIGRPRKAISPESSA